MFVMSLTKTRLLANTSSKLLSVEEITGGLIARLSCLFQSSVAN